MTRIKRFSAGALLVLFVSTCGVAWAGDSDGVAGYSMKLKNKNFDDSGYGNGSGNLTYSPDKDQEPQMSKFQSAVDVQYDPWVAISIRGLVLMIWLR